MAHVGGIGQVVGAIKPREKLIEKGGFVAGAPGCVEDGFVGIVEVIEVPGDGVKCRGPGDGMIMRILAPLDHRTDEASLLSEPVIRLSAQLLQRKSLEKFFRDDVGGGFMGDSFDAVFTKLSDSPRAIGIRPATPWAIKPLLLIDREKGLATSQNAGFVRGVFEGRENGGNATGAPGGRVKLKVVRIFDRDFPRRD